MCARGRMCAQCLHDPGAARIARSIIKFAGKKKKNSITCNQYHCYYYYYYYCVGFVWLFCILPKKCVSSWVFGKSVTKLIWEQQCWSFGLWLMAKILSSARHYHLQGLMAKTISFQGKKRNSECQIGALFKNEGVEQTNLEEAQNSSFSSGRWGIKLKRGKLALCQINTVQKSG